MKETKIQKKEKNKQKKKDWIKGILLIILLFIIAGFVLVIYGRITKVKEEVVNVTNVLDSIEKYGYTLNDNVTDYYKQEFDVLKNLEDEDEVAKQVAKLFIIDLYSIDYKINKYEVTSTQYFYSDKRDMHRSKVLDTIYKSIQDNSYGDRKQELPEVKNVEVENFKKDTFNIESVDEKGKVKKDPRDSYVVTLKIEYVKNLGYDDEAEVTLIKDGENNISVVKFRVN